jgi:dihydrofolate reductase/thymidylate synthase
MINIIIAMTQDYGIGLKGRLPWNIKEELQIFRNKTLNNILIVGRKTAETLPFLKDRTIICITNNKNLDTSSYKNKTIPFLLFDNAIKHCTLNYPTKKIFLAGGASLYTYIITNYYHLVKKIHISVIKDSYECDTFVPILSNNTNINTSIIKTLQHFTNFTHTTLINQQHTEYQYINLLKKVYLDGSKRVGRNGTTISSFGEHFKFDLRNGFPLLTTKKMFFRGIVEELLFFIRGHTNSKLLENKKINIWSGNTNRVFLDNNGHTSRPTGIMGPMYGYQWRHFNAEYDEKSGIPLEKGIDQLQLVIDLIKNDPHSRRIIMTDFNPLQSHLGVLYPCHSLILQFYVDTESKTLDMYCFNRSSDIFLGLPFNIASSSLLLILIGKLTNLTPRYFNLSLGDAHIYEQHIDACKKQIERQPYIFPSLIINPEKKLTTIKNIEHLEYTDFTLNNYQHHPAIKVQMVS